MNDKILGSIGLSEREIAVYKALLVLGSTTTGPLVRESGVQNAKIYETLEKLIKKGIATYIFKGKIKHFQPAEPKTLLSFFDERRAALQKTVDELSVLKNKQKPECTVVVYEGVKAIKAVFYEMYDHIGKNAEYCVFPIGEQLRTEELVNFWGQVFVKAKGMKIGVRTLPNKKWKQIFQRFYSKYTFIKARYTEQEFPTGVFIFKDYILNVVWAEKPVAFLIKSKENYEKWQRFFDEQWEKRE